MRDSDFVYGKLGTTPSGPVKNGEQGILKASANRIYPFLQPEKHLQQITQGKAVFPYFCLQENTPRKV